jgi:hypothetical protein
VGKGREKMCFFWFIGRTLFLNVVLFHLSPCRGLTCKKEQNRKQLTNMNSDFSDNLVKVVSTRWNSKGDCNQGIVQILQIILLLVMNVHGNNITHQFNWDKICTNQNSPSLHFKVYISLLFSIFTFVYQYYHSLIPDPGHHLIPINPVFISSQS